MGLITFFDNHRSILFWTAAAITLVFLILMAAKQGFRPAGTPSLVDLEIAGDPARFSQILDSWRIAEAGKLELLRTNVFLDFGFLLGYSLLLAGVAVTTLPGQVSRTGWLVVLALLIGLADTVENLGLLQGLNALNAAGSENQSTVGPLSIMAAASHTKWLLLTFITLVLAYRLFAAFRSGIPTGTGIVSAVFLLALGLFLWNYFTGLGAVFASTG